MANYSKQQNTQGFYSLLYHSTPPHPHLLHNAAIWPSQRRDLHHSHLLAPLFLSVASHPVLLLDSLAPHAVLLNLTHADAWLDLHRQTRVNLLLQTQAAPLSQSW